MIKEISDIMMTLSLLFGLMTLFGIGLLLLLKRLKNLPWWALRLRVELEEFLD
ncbi:MAG: hypothetical protein QME52_05345 [Bacteroidota bacterium]|nr:hypothetical protein [Bacteroidota bacterium]